MKCPKCGGAWVNGKGIEGPLEAFECSDCGQIFFVGVRKPVKEGKA